MGEIVIGTSGYSYLDWVGPVYPSGTERKNFLKLYAAEFSMVELNFSYYRQPVAGMMERMVRNTPDGFRFAIKAHQSLTHSPEADISPAVTTFREGILPLHDSKRLAAVLFQFPYSFHYTPDARRHLLTLCRAFEGYPLAVEFRSDEWQRNSVYQGLRDFNAAFVNVDAPALPRLPLKSDTVTADLGYIRFHGRNKENWWQGSNVSRYDYRYRQEELSEWLPIIDSIARQVRLLLVAFNNHSGGKAVHNARELQAMLSG